MGQDKKQRVKGNLKPANSSRAADLLPTTAPTLPTNLGGFAQFASGVSLPSTSSGTSSPEPDSSFSATNLDPDVVVVLKMLSKRDTTTKLRALEELEEWIKAKEEGNAGCVALIGIWTKIYIKLTNDVDRRVRIQTQTLNLLLVMRIKKKLAPHLRDIIGAWVCTFFDQSKEVGRIAMEAFQAAFPPAKRSEALLFGQAEVLAYVTDNLMYKTPETLSDPRFVSKEDMQAKYARVISSSLQGLGYLIDQISPTDLTRCLADYEKLFDDQKFWSYTSHENPYIRRGAYIFLKTCVVKWPEVISPRLELVSSTFLFKVFTDKETSTHSELWDALLVFTKQFPSSWVLAGTKKPMLPKLYYFIQSGCYGSARVSYPSLLALVANLPEELTRQLEFHENFFNSLWKGFGSTMVDKTNSHFLLDSFAECLVFFVARLRKSNTPEAKNIQTYLVNVKLWEFLETYIIDSGNPNLREKIDPATYNETLTKHFVQLSALSGIEDDFNILCTKLHELVISIVTSGLLPTKSTGPQLDFIVSCRRLGNLLASISVKAEQQQTKILMKNISDLVIEAVPKALDSYLRLGGSAGLVIFVYKLIGPFGDTLFAESGFIMEMDSLMLKGSLPALMSTTQTESLDEFIAVMVIYMIRVGEPEKEEIAWNQIVQKVLAVTDVQKQMSVLKVILGKILELGAVKKCYVNKALDDFIVDLAVKNFDKEKHEDLEEFLRSLVEDVLSLALVFEVNTLLSNTALDRILSHFSTMLSYVNYVFSLTSNMSTSNLHTIIFTTSSILSILQRSLSSPPFLRYLFAGNSSLIIAEIFNLMFLKAELGVNEGTDETSVPLEAQLISVIAVAENCWNGILKILNNDQEKRLRLDIGKMIIERVKESIVDLRHSASPADFGRQATRILSDLYPEADGARQEAISRFLFDPAHWLNESVLYSAAPLDISLSILDPLISISRTYTRSTKETEIGAIKYDVYGLSGFGRLALFTMDLIKYIGIEQFFIDDEKNSSKDWIILPLLLARQLCDDNLTIIGTNGIWDASSHVSDNAFAFQSFNESVREMTTKFLKLVAEVDGSDSKKWVAALKEMNMESKGRITNLLGRAFQLVNGDHGQQWARVLKTFLEKMKEQFQFSVNDADIWLEFIKGEGTTCFKASIIFALRTLLRESSKFKIFQNDLASKLSGISREQIIDENSTEGWEYLALLNTTAQQASDTFLPQQRVIYLLQSIYKWYEVTGSGNITPTIPVDVNRQLSKLLRNIAPTIQTMSGRHWSFMHERIVEWISSANTSNSDGLVLAYESLQLFAELQEFASSNEDLAKVLESQAKFIFSGVLGLLLGEKENVNIPKPRAEYQELLAQIARDIPRALLIEKDISDKLISLLKSSTTEIQKCSYLLLKPVIIHSVQDLIGRLELVSITEEVVEAHLPRSLINLLKISPDLKSFDAGEETSTHEIVGFLLAWMALFDHFENIIFQLKSSYVQNLRDIDVMDIFLPVLFHILGLAIIPTPFELSKWSISEFDIEGFDANSEVGFSLLAAHLYYRSLTHIPSLVRQWWIECKNRGLNIAVENYTEKYFSSLIIGEEINALSSPTIKEQLEGENLTVKASKVANEVTASYRIDDQAMEMSIKLPSNFPLSQVKVEGPQRVGVPEDRWRGWLLAASSIITAQNGSIFDALTVFKKNVSLYFDGIEDCTICYSIISIQDRSLPVKQCKTCKNKFHSSCLYKWFRTSNSSSCPLCRTLF